MRNRLAAFASSHLDDNRVASRIVQWIEQTTGSEVPSHGTRKSLARFFKSAQLRDSLDTVAGSGTRVK